MRFSRCLIYQDENHLGQIAMLSEAESGAEGGSRTHTGVTPKVFETFASAIPPLRLLDARITVSFTCPSGYPK